VAVASDRKTTRYLQEVFQLALRQQLEPLCERLPLGALAPFGRVLLEDSTPCRLHEKLADAFKGSGGSASPSAVKIDLIYDVLHHSLLEMHLCDGTAADQGRALAIIPHLRPDDLVLRDLGYLSLESLRQIEAQEAWYLSRLSKGVDVYLEADAQAPALALVEPLERYYPDDSVMDLPVYLGHERMPCRLLAYRLPEPVVQERRRKAVQEARKKGRELSQEYLDWLSFGFYITNVSQQVWPAKVVETIYRLRWQVGVSREGHINPVGESPTEVRSSSLVAWEAPWREIKTVEPSDTMLSWSMRKTPGCNVQ